MNVCGSHLYHLMVFSCGFVHGDSTERDTTTLSHSAHKYILSISVKCVKHFCCANLYLNSQILRVTSHPTFHYITIVFQSGSSLLKMFFKCLSLLWLIILGEQVAVFRGQDGKAYVVDAYCPHLGANLAVGGRVVGSCIECPFHGWQFRGNDGKCVRIPYAEKGMSNYIYSTKSMWHE